MEEYSKKMWALPFMLQLNKTESSPVRLNVRAAEKNILVEIHPHKVTIQVRWLAFCRRRKSNMI